jgi:hypothetical protein
VNDSTVTCLDGPNQRAKSRVNRPESQVELGVSKRVTLVMTRVRVAGCESTALLQSNLSSFIPSIQVCSCYCTHLTVENL